MDLKNIHLFSNLELHTSRFGREHGGNRPKVSSRDSGNASRLTNHRQLQLEQDSCDERWKNYGKPEHESRTHLTAATRGPRRRAGDQ
jgi:hypothetical protein